MARTKQSKLQKKVSDTNKPKKKWKPGTVARREANYYKNKQGVTIHKAPLNRIIKEILVEQAKELNIQHNFLISSAALEILRAESESYLIQFFKKCAVNCMHRNRVTINANDLLLVKKNMEDSNGDSNIINENESLGLRSSSFVCQKIPSYSSFRNKTGVSIKEDNRDSSKSRTESHVMQIAEVAASQVSSPASNFTSDSSDSDQQ